MTTLSAPYSKKNAITWTVIPGQKQTGKYGLDYSPFGALMPGRNGNSGEYRYGAGGQEKTDEISGVGNHYTAEYWEMDPRLGRRWNIDPVVKPHESPYATFANNPIWFNDPNGADSIKINSGQGNVILWFNYENAKLDYKQMTQENNNWDFVEVNSVKNLKKTVKKYLKQINVSSIQNVVFRSHGNKNLLEYERNTGMIDANDVDAYNRGEKEGGDKMFIDALKYISSKMTTVGHGMFVFTACYAANPNSYGHDVADKVSDVMFKANQNISILFNYNSGKWQGVTDEDGRYIGDYGYVSDSWRKFSMVNSQKVERNLYKVFYINYTGAIPYGFENETTWQLQQMTKFFQYP